MTTSFFELDSKEVLVPSFLKSYIESLELISRELRRLNSYVFILDKILHFPSELFLAPDKQSFLTLVNFSFTESAFLIITKLITDKRNDTFTINRLKNIVVKNVKEPYKESYCCFLEENKFGETIKILKKQAEDVKNIRDNMVAHLLVDQNYHLKVPKYKVTWEKINQITVKINMLFGLFCFNCEYMLLPLDYDPRVQHPPGADSRSDIEYFLDLLVQDSYFYRMPDESRHWKIIKEKLESEKLKILNDYRKKFGKPEA